MRLLEDSRTFIGFRNFQEKFCDLLSVQGVGVKWL